MFSWIIGVYNRLSLITHIERLKYIFEILNIYYIYLWNVHKHGWAFILIFFFFSLAFLFHFFNIEFFYVCMLVKHYTISVKNFDFRYVYGIFGSKIDILECEIGWWIFSFFYLFILYAMMASLSMIKWKYVAFLIFKNLIINKIHLWVHHVLYNTSI